MSAPTTEQPEETEAALGSRLREVLRRVEEAARRAGRAPSEVTLIAVSKTHPAALVARAVSAGQSDFGENRVQEAEAKIAEIGGLAAKAFEGGRLASKSVDDDGPSIDNGGPLAANNGASVSNNGASVDGGGPAESAAPRWHLIGHLQANKARRAVKLFDLIHTVDSAALVGRLERLCEEEGRDELPVLVQLSLAGEATKAGATEDELGEVVARFKDCRRVRLAGLMTMPPYSEDAERARPFFRRLRELRDRLREGGAFGAAAGHLSMGMSHDFEIAVEEGATLVRVGTAVFGERAAAR